jgi:hypothetical protein
MALKRQKAKKPSKKKSEVPDPIREAVKLRLDEERGGRLVMD